MIERIMELLKEQDVCKQIGEISFNFMGQNIPIINKDIVGGILQHWFGCWLLNNGIIWNNGKIHSQAFPDFVLNNGDYLEFKVFDADANPNFDVANFDSYINSLTENPERLDANYLIFSYRMKDGKIQIVDFWIKKVWEMTGCSKKNILNIQVKHKTPINIRPKNWRNKKVRTFNNRYEFVLQLNQAIQHFKPNKYPNWLNEVSTQYQIKTGRLL